MQAHSSSLSEPSRTILGAMSGQIEANYAIADGVVQPVEGGTRFTSHFTDSMEMYAEAKAVGEYLDMHQGWFRRCAQPMQVELISKNGYALSLGRFGALGYEVEPKIGLDLLPGKEGIYRIETIPVPDYEPPGYEVDFKASLQLLEVSKEKFTQEWQVRTPRNKATTLPDVVTLVDWQLDLTVEVLFPKFIQVLPENLIRSTGDRVLHEIVKQISRRLTYKVQQDFHSTKQLPFWKKYRRK